ncbi:MAG: hypothetical protein ACFCU1_06925 [Sumerlaeia bacterium]
MADQNTDLERIQKKLQEVEALQKRNKMTGTLSSVAILIVAIVMIGIVAKPFLTIYNEREKMSTRLEEQAIERILPKAQEELQLLVNEVVPKYRDEAQRILESRQTEIVDEVSAEYETLYANLSDQITERMTTFLTDFSERQYTMLIEEFPELSKMDETPDPANPDVKRSHMIAFAVKDATARFSGEIFAKHMQALDKMDLEFNSLEIPESYKAMSNDELKNFVAEEAVQFFIDKIDNEEQEVEGN